ncbi:MAG: pSer/pThr/pTyr-binding forkhead associated (FHA) protein [Candidatus Binatia bacterium]|jgi:pSer/pThr/pTyr-binding forkhead associated (FHA) protein
MDKPLKEATIATSSVLPRKGRITRPHYLEQTEGDGGIRLFKLSDKELIIGRAEDANVRLISPKASRHHAILNRSGDEYVIRDNGSRNGVFLNGLKVHSAIIRDGDLIQVADSEFSYREG